MRLFNVRTRTFEQFYANIPEYAVASHRWAVATETSYQDVQEQCNTHKEGYKKLEGFAEYIKTHLPDIEWLWIDTCCIDQKNNAELSEAINSMSKWYQKAVICLAYLADVRSSEDEDEFRHSEWFTRGWTLQELIAPQTVIFLTKGWQVVGHKGVDIVNESRALLAMGRCLTPLVALITGIPEAVLHDPRQIEAFSREERLKWVHSRSTTREEDMAYCLVGILDAAIGANYGEGAQRARRRLLKEIGLMDADPVQLRASSNVPFRRDPDYIDRTALVAQMDVKLAAPAARVALVGFGGVGKSQLAIEYSYRLREQSPDTWVLWIHASNAARFEQAVREVAEVLKIHGRHEAKTEIFQLVWTRLRDAQKGRWLIVLDNVDDARFLLEPPIVTENAEYKRRIDYLPTCDHGKILVTSRSVDEARKIVEHTDMVKVRPMETGDALSLLEKKLGQQNNRTDAITLAETLEFIPLALTQAASYIVQMGRRYTVQRYLEKVRRSNSVRESVLDSALGDHQRDREAENAIFLTWQISFEHIHRERRSAADLLSIMSFCDRQAIPEILVRIQDSRSTTDRAKRGVELSKEAGEDPAGASDLISDEDAEFSDRSSNGSLDDSFDADIATLEGYSFLSIPAADTSVFEMHRLVQHATQRWLVSQGLLEGYKEKYVDKLFSVFPGAAYENWSVCQKLFPHARSLVQQRPHRKEFMLQWATILYNAAWYAGEQGNTVDAQEMSSLCVKVREKALGKEHPSTLTSVSNLAGVLRDQGKYETAEEMNRRALEGWEKALGKEHPDTLTSVYCLAYLYHQTRHFAAALPLYERAYAGYVNALGSAHPTTRACAAHMASLRDS